MYVVVGFFITKAAIAAGTNFNNNRTQLDTFAKKIAHAHQFTHFYNQKILEHLHN